jgi:hypothetical protein
LLLASCWISFFRSTSSRYGISYSLLTHGRCNLTFFIFFSLFKINIQHRKILNHYGNDKI